MQLLHLRYHFIKFAIPTRLPGSQWTILIIPVFFKYKDEFSQVNFGVTFSIYVIVKDLFRANSILSLKEKVRQLLDLCHSHFKDGLTSIFLAIFLLPCKFHKIKVIQIEI